MDEPEPRRVRLFRGIRQGLYRRTHGGSDPWDELSRMTAHYAEVGTATRCKVCGLSIRGPLGFVNRAFWGVAPMHKHPDLCNLCRVGDRVLEVTVLFADARGFTGFAEGRPPDEVAETMNKMFKSCTQTLFAHDALVDKMMGDAVMALFGAPIMRPDHREQAVAAALAIQDRAAQMFPADWSGACVRIGINSGAAFVGSMGSSNCRDYTAVGDTVNVAQRLQTEAEPGEVLMSDAVYDAVREVHPAAERRVLTVKGREEPVVAYAIAAAESAKAP